MKTFRPDVKKALARSQDFLTKKLKNGSITMDDLVVGLILQHQPSRREYNWVRNQVQVDVNGDPNWFAMSSGNNEIRVYNKKHPHNQEIGARWVSMPGPHGKEIKRSLLYVIYGVYADQPIKHANIIQQGYEDKKTRLEQKRRNGKKVKAAADRLKARIYS